MMKTCTQRDWLYQIWENKVLHGGSDPSNFFDEDKNRYQLFCVAKDNIQDTVESLMVHRENGFSTNGPIAYLELCGVLQAVFVLQDSIRLLCKEVFEQDFKAPTAWQDLRDLRNCTIGHPNNQSQNRDNVLKRFSVVRGTIYSQLCISGWQDGNRRQLNRDLSELLDKFDQEAAYELRKLTICLQRKTRSLGKQTP